MTCGKGKKDLPCHFREGVPEYPPSVRPSFLTHKHCKHVSMIELLVSAFQTGVVFLGILFFIFFSFSVWGTFPCYLLHFGEINCTLMNFGAFVLFIDFSILFHGVP